MNVPYYLGTGLSNHVLRDNVDYDLLIHECRERIVTCNLGSGEVLPLH